MGPGLYRALLRLFPAGFREDCGDEAGDVFEALWREAPGASRRGRLLAEGLRRLPAALWSEWWTTLRGAPTGGPSNRNGRGGMEGWWRNVRMGARALRRAPAFAWTAILLTGLGVGAVTTIFTVVDHVLLRPLPYPEAERLVFVERGSHSGPFFRAAQELRTIERWAASFTTDANLSGEGDPLRLSQAHVSRDAFEVLGGRVIRGRALSAGDFATGAHVALLDGRAWESIWGADPDVVGRTIVLDGEPVVVVGVLDPAVTLPEVMSGRGSGSGRAHVLRPLDWSAPELVGESYSVLALVGRLAPETSVEAAQAEMDALVRRLAATSEQYRERDGAPRLLPVTRLADVTVRGVRAGLGLLLGAVGMLLLVACANVAHLFLARGLGRRREMAVRRAMGAGTGGLVRQLLTESLLVGLAGGALGVALAQAGLASLIALSPEALPRQDAVTLDLRVLVFAAALSAATALVFGLLPALRSVGGDLTGELHGSGRSTTAGRGVQGLRRLLVAGEVALSLVLVAGAGLLLRSFMRVQAQDPGFEAPRVWTLPLTPTGIDDPAEWVLAMGGIRDALAAAPGVEEATYALTTPLEFAGGGRCCWRTGITVEGREDAQPTAIHPVSAEYFETLGIGLRAGRSWAAADARAEPTPVVVSEAFAVALYGAADAAVGRPLAFGDFQATVVGVAGDVRHYGLDTDADPALYLPIERLPFAIPKVTMAVRLRADASAGLGRALREAVWSAAPDMPVPILRSMDEWQERGTAGRRFESVLTGMFAMLALLLAAGGLYGTLLYLAGQRRRELGIRLALGASRARIERQVLVGGLVMAGLGVGIGLAGAWASGRLLQSRLWGIEAGDPLTLSVSAALLLATALLASWVPARRAGRTDPLETLRVE